MPYPCLYKQGWGDMWFSACANEYVLTGGTLTPVVIEMV